MNAVADEPVVTSEALQAAGGVNVADALRHVDVNADAEIFGQPGGGLQRVVRAGEGGMDADVARTSRLDEPFVFLQTPLGAVWAVAVGDAVGSEYPDAHFGAGVGDDIEAPLDGVW